MNALKREVEVIKSKILDGDFSHRVKRSGENIKDEPYQNELDDKYIRHILYNPKLLVILIFILSGTIIVIAIMSCKFNQMTQILKSTNQNMTNQPKEEPQCKISMSKMNPAEDLILNNNASMGNQIRKRKSTIKDSKKIPGRRSTLTLLEGLANN